jgi:hypothetical protein
LQKLQKNKAPKMGLGVKKEQAFACSFIIYFLETAS